MKFIKLLSPFIACALLASHALADTEAQEIVPVEPAVIEQIAAEQEPSESVPEPGTFGAICLGIATVIYARRWRRRN